MMNDKYDTLKSSLKHEKNKIEILNSFPIKKELSYLKAN